MEILMDRGGEKTNPIQSQTKPIAGLWPEIRNNTNGSQMTDSGIFEIVRFEKTKPISNGAE